MSNASYLRLLVWINGAVPGVMLAWDAWRRQLAANAVNDAIRTTGLIALSMLTLSLVVTPLRRATGWNALISARRPLGLWGFYYALVHLSLYVGLDRAMDLGSTLSEVLTRRYLQVGSVAILGMVPLALTSTDGMVRRLGAKRWKLLHRLAYVVVAAGVLHYYMLVKSDVRQPLAFAGVLGLLFAARGVTGVSDLRATAAKRKPMAALGAAAAAAKPRFWRGELEVARVFQETPDVKTFRLVPVGGGPLPFDHQPGQYLTLQFEADGRRVTRCYTIASPPSRGHYCEISVKREPHGVSSRWLHDTIREGSRLQIGAPAGKFVFHGREANRVALVAGGVGVTPLASIVRYLTDIGWRGPIDFVLAARNQEGLIFRRELEHLAERFDNLRVHMILSDAEGDTTWTGERGRLAPELLARWLGERRDFPVFVCGPKPMMDAVVGMLRGIGFPADRVLTEEFVSSAELATSGASGAPSTPDGAAIDASVRFVRAGVEAPIAATQSLLEAAEDAGVELPFECRSGVCGQCKVRLASGRVTMDAEDALTSAEKAAGWVLACQAHALEDLAVEA